MSAQRRKVLGGSASPAVRAVLAAMGEQADGGAGFHRPALRALSILYQEGGPKVDPIPLIIRIVRIVLRRGERDEAYVAGELRGLIKWSRVLADRECERRARADTVRAVGKRIARCAGACSAPSGGKREGE